MQMQQSRKSFCMDVVEEGGVKSNKRDVTVERAPNKCRFISLYHNQIYT